MSRSVTVLVLSLALLASACVAGDVDSATPRASAAPTPSGSLPSSRASDALISTLPSRPFPRNRQSEASVAVDPVDPDVIVAGMNDVSDARCRRYDDRGCVAVHGVGVSGLSFSFDGGATWSQPSYPGRIGDEAAEIHTLPGYREVGLVARGDPTLAIGPRPARDGSFAWSNGSRVYYGNIASALPGRHARYDGRSAIAVSRTDQVERAARGDADAWRRPAIVSSRTGEDGFNDKPWIAVDDAASSPSFGSVYACWTVFGGVGPSPTIVFSRSTDGGATWSPALPLTTDANVNERGGRQGCQVATDARGRVFATWIDTPERVRDSIQVLARSTDGGRTFGDPVRIAEVHPVGERDPLSHGKTFDGVAGSRSNSFPSIAIANGAPAGSAASNAIAVAWADGAKGERERASVTVSTDGGHTWSEPTDAAEPGDRPAMVAVAISPDGGDLYVVYDAFATPWRAGLDVARPVGAVIRHATVEDGEVSAWATIHRGAVGDARGATTSTLVHGTLYDYNDAVATAEGVVAVWADARRVERCRAVDRYRARRLDRDDRTEAMSPVEGERDDRGDASEGEDEEEDPSVFAPAPPRAPAPRRSCPDGFGDVDVFGGAFSPTP